MTESTRIVYQREIRRLMEWTDLSWGEITSRQLRQYKAHLKNQKLNGKTLALTTINRAIAALKVFFRWLADKDIINADPASSLNFEKIEAPLALDLSDEQVTALRQVVTSCRDKAILELMLSSGVRAGEVVALNVGDYDRVRIRIIQGKHGSVGTIPLPRETRRLLDEYLMQRTRKSSRFTSPSKSDSPLFLSESPATIGQRLSYQGLYKIFKRWTLAADLDANPHRTRHTYATKLLLMGIDPLHARTLTRHKSEANFKRYSLRALSIAAENAYFEAIGETL